jgi:hypothetical protein
LGPNGQIGIEGNKQTGVFFIQHMEDALAVEGDPLQAAVVLSGQFEPPLPQDLAGLVQLDDFPHLFLHNPQGGIFRVEDVLHITYVQHLRLYEIEILRAPTDGIDLEFSSGEMRGARVVGAGDDCLDLMGADLRVADSILQTCTNNALSAGEESQVNAHGLFISDSKTGLLAKNNSHVRITRSLIYRNSAALKTKRREIHYMGASSIGASDLFIADCGQAIDGAPGTRSIEAEQIQQALPTQGALNHLVHHVLGLSDWSAFDRYMARHSQEAQL